ncbi:hypothetical protein CPB83DRAFT_859784 [Crepidotus variabilis]|uniref:BTB domain-containing protein n=1 Tax=Crepidotus variabilis TaxID=179855 RepID=A0A9P6EA26_9AGAR|nr:hypothetical protein CPB83DRAFT_859784 [Crepidotus variabilis]
MPFIVRHNYISESLPALWSRDRHYCMGTIQLFPLSHQPLYYNIQSSSRTMNSSCTHVKFNANDADVVIQSSDHIQFRLHCKHLEAHTGAFPGMDVKTYGEIVELSEPAGLLEILFAFTSPQRYPDLEDLKFDSLLALSEAVEKYEVYAAMYPCVTGLNRFIREYPIDILTHGLKHDYPKLIDEAAQHLLFSPPIPTVEKVPATFILS